MIHPDSGVVNCPDKTDIGVVLDVPSYDAEWRVSTVAKVLRRFYPRWSDAIFGELIARFDVPTDRKIKQLSRGMGMKLQIAAAFAHDARFLVLDEPTSGLDPLSRDELTEIIGDFMMDEHRTVLFSSHITSDIERIADYVAVIDKGQLVEYAAIGPDRLIPHGAWRPLATQRSAGRCGIRAENPRGRMGWAGAGRSDRRGPRRRSDRNTFPGRHRRPNRERTLTSCSHS